MSIRHAPQTQRTDGIPAAAAATVSPAVAAPVANDRTFRRSSATSPPAVAESAEEHSNGGLGAHLYYAPKEQ